MYQDASELPSDFRGAIVAMTRDRVIGVDGDMPWHYSEDLKRFRRLTTGTTIVMGRLTFEAIGSKPLPKRRNIVISRTEQPGVDTFSDIEQALASCNGPVWIIGGAQIYQAALDFCDVIDVVYVPDRIDAANAVRFPELSPAHWCQSDVVPFETDSRLKRCLFERRRAQACDTAQYHQGKNMKIDIGDFSVNVEISGKEDGPVVMMAHSLGCNRRMWDPQMPILEPHYRVVRLDMRGHGDSDAPDGPYTLDQLADDVIAVMDHLKINRAHWVGLSIGGMIGQSLLLRYPARFISATLCDTMPVMPEENSPAWAERIQKVKQDGLGSIADATMERWFTQAYLAGGHPGADSVRQQIAVTTDKGYLACCNAIMGLNYIDRLPEITTPVLLMVGAEDFATPVSASETMHERIPDSELVIIDDASHISNVEQAEVFNSHLQPFLQAHAARS